MILTKPLPYQWEGARGIQAFCSANGGTLLADEMGLGKTLQVLLWLWKRQKVRPVIVVCPASLKYNWQREALNHFNMGADVLNGRRVAKEGLLRRSTVLIINYEILHHWKNYLVSLRPICVVWDEAHYIQNRESLRFKSLRKLIEEAQVPFRIAMSGTPLTNRHAELWTSLFLLRPDLFPSWFDYAFEYCVPAFVRGKWEFSGSRQGKKLHEILTREVMIRRTKKQVAKQLPEKVRSMVVVKLSRADRMEYELCDQHFLRWVKMRYPERLHKAKKAPHLTKVGYLLRLLIKAIRWDAKEWIDNFAQESDGKLVVFSMSTKMLHWLHSHFPHNSVVIDGTVTGLKRQRAVDAFQHSPRVRFAFCNPKAAGVGLTLHAASNVLYTDFPWAPGTVKQGEDRIHRIGQTKKCFVWFLAALDTISERLCTLLMEKQEILDEVLDGIESGRDFDVFQELLRPTKRKGLLQ